MVQHAGAAGIKAGVHKKVCILLVWVVCGVLVLPVAGAAGDSEHKTSSQQAEFVPLLLCSGSGRV